MGVLPELLAEVRVCPEDSEVVAHAARNIGEVREGHRVDLLRVAGRSLLQHSRDALLGEDGAAAVGVVDDGELLEVEQRVDGQEAVDLRLDPPTDAAYRDGLERLDLHELVRLAAWIRARYDEHSWTWRA